MVDDSEIDSVVDSFLCPQSVGGAAKLGALCQVEPLNYWSEVLGVSTTLTPGSAVAENWESLVARGVLPTSNLWGYWHPEVCRKCSGDGLYWRPVAVENPFHGQTSNCGACKRRGIALPARVVDIPSVAAQLISVAANAEALVTTREYAQEAVVRLSPFLALFAANLAVALYYPLRQTSSRGDLTLLNHTTDLAPFVGDLREACWWRLSSVSARTCRRTIEKANSKIEKRVGYTPPGIVKQRVVTALKTHLAGYIWWLVGRQSGIALSDKLYLSPPEKTRVLADVPNPFEPLLSIWKQGFIPAEIISDHFVVGIYIGSQQPAFTSR